MTGVSKYNILLDMKELDCMEREIRRFELDFSNCSTWGEVYCEIKKKLELPDWCGENLDALWDAVTGMMYTPAHITVSKKVKNNGLAADVQQIISVLYEAEEKYGQITVIEEY